MLRERLGREMVTRHPKSLLCRALHAGSLRVRDGYEQVETPSYLAPMKDILVTSVHCENMVSVPCAVYSDHEYVTDVGPAQDALVCQHAGLVVVVVLNKGVLKGITLDRDGPTYPPMFAFNTKKVASLVSLYSRYSEKRNG
jgi:hypothetical protein